MAEMTVEMEVAAHSPGYEQFLRDITQDTEKLFHHLSFAQRAQALRRKPQWYADLHQITVQEVEEVAKELDKLVAKQKQEAQP